MPDLTEAQTRAKLIDPAHEQAGWALTDAIQVGFEIPVPKFGPRSSLGGMMKQVRA